MSVQEMSFTENQCIYCGAFLGPTSGHNAVCIMNRVAEQEQTIKALRERNAELEADWSILEIIKERDRALSELADARKAFIGYVEDSHRRRDEPMPPVIGLCVTCHFPVYESEHGGLFHYTYDSTKVCARAAIPENGATEAK